MNLHDILKVRSSDSKSLRRASLLSAYYNGFLNVSCGLKKDGNQVL